MKFSAKNISFSYSKNKGSFDNVSLEAQNGEIIALLGANGSGKTTLIKCLLGFLKIKSGEIKLDGENISDIPNREFWQRIGYVPQAKGSYSSLDVRNMILLGCAGKTGVFSSPSKEDIEKCEAIAKHLGIDHLLDRKCSEISGGELQMVLIARAIITDPEILFFDEPESNLDFKNQLIVLNTLQALKKEGKCIILSTHYPEHALSHSDKALMFIGKTSVFGRTDEILSSENIQKAFGVDTVISEIKCEETVYKNIIPVKLTKKGE